MAEQKTEIRVAQRSDLYPLVTIYNHYILTSHSTFDIEPFTLESRIPWWSTFDGQRYQCLVALRGKQILGYACSMPLKPKAAYATSVEISVYLAPDECGRGLGGRLYENLLESLSQQDVHRAYAVIALPNDASMRLHQAFGFRQVSHLSEVGRKFDRYWDVVWLERDF